MEQKDNFFEVAEQMFAEKGISAGDWIAYIGEKNSKLLNLNEENLNKIIEYYHEIENNTYSQDEKGKKLEDLANIFFYEGYPSIFECRRNCRTSTNEIDLLISWNLNARFTQLPNVFPCFGDSFLCECKNYSRKANVTYVGKFYSLLRSSNAKLGVFISWHGITGKGWSDAVGLVKKIALKDQIYIIVIDKEDILELGKGNNNILNLINDKYQALKNDIDYSKYIIKHECEEYFSEDKSNSKE